MTAEKKPLTEEERLEDEMMSPEVKAQIERIDKMVAERVYIPPTGKRGKMVKTIPPTTQAEKERIENILAKDPRIIQPTGKMDTRVFDPVEIRGKPLSQTIIEMRYCGLPPDEETEIEERR